MAVRHNRLGQLLLGGVGGTPVEVLFDPTES